MCGACGARDEVDWARPWVAGPAARAAVATAVGRLLPVAGVRISAAAGGWLVTRPTGASTVCATLSDLVAAARSSTPAPPAPLDPAHPSGRLAVPPRDGRAGIVVRVDPHSPPSPLHPSALHQGALHPGALRQGPVVVPDEATALATLAELAGPRWLRRAYLERVEGVRAPWGGLPVTLAGTFVSPAHAADAVVGLEWARQDGRYAALALRCPLDDGTDLDVEIRAGHVVRARPLPRR